MASLGLMGCEQTVCLVGCDGLDPGRDLDDGLVEHEGLYSGSVELDVYLQSYDYAYQCEGTVHIEVDHDLGLRGSYANCGEDEDWRAFFGHIEGSVRDDWLSATWNIERHDEYILPLSIESSIIDGHIETSLTSERQWFEIKHSSMQIDHI